LEVWGLIRFDKERKMTTRVDYTTEEWAGLLRAPVMAGTYIVLADVSLTAIPRELKGLARAVRSQPVPPAAAELVGAVVADLTAGTDAEEELSGITLDEAQDWRAGLDRYEDPRQQVLKLIKQDLAALEDKAAAEEKEAFYTWLVDVAQATAEAGREGGFLGIGAVRVSEQERAALTALGDALGLDQPSAPSSSSK
jgi:hypothetical protein